MLGHFLPTRGHEEQRCGGGVGRPGWASGELCGSAELINGPEPLLDQELLASGPSLTSSDFSLTPLFSAADAH